jgi:Putative Flp pilus-assembly TadE/G-like
MDKNFSISQKAITALKMRVFRDERGSTVPIYAVGLLLLATASAAAITVNQQALTTTTLQGAADSASLAATNVYAELKSKQSINKLTNAQIEAKARAAGADAYANNAGDTNIALAPSNIVFDVKVDQNGNVTGVSTRVSPSGTTPTFMGAFLGDSAPKVTAVAAESHRGIGAGTSAYTTTDTTKQRNLEVVLVLDITGSMSGTIAGDTESKMVGLRKAVKSFVNGVYGDTFSATATPPANIKIGIIPYSNVVNVGKLLGSGELNVPADIAGWVALNNSNGWKGCIVERSTTPNLVALDPVGGVTVRADALDIVDAPQNITPEKWTPYYSPPTEFYQQYSQTTVTNGKSTTKTLGKRSIDQWGWFRPSDFNSTRAPLRLVRNSVSEYWREDVAAPAETQARDANGNVAPRLTASSASTGVGSPNDGCITAALPLASGYSKKQIGDYVDNLSPGGWTHSNLGMAWANRMLSPWAPLAGAKNYGDGKTDKLIVLMTDGYITSGDIYGTTTNSSSMNAGEILKDSAVQNPAGYFKVDDSGSFDGTQMSWAGYYYGYGMSALNRLVGTRTDGKPYSNASGHILAHQQRLLMACKVARTPYGYTGSDPATKVYTILFGFSLPTGARNIYEECATVPGYALTAESSSKLTEAFTKISDQSKLQLTE